MKKTVLALSGLITASVLAVPATGKVIGTKVRAEGSGEVTIDQNHFPDEIFREYVRQFDTDGNGKFSESELKKVTDIDVQCTPLQSMKGIEYFTSLKSLMCNQCDLSTAGLDLSKNTELEDLDCESCNMKSLDLTHNTKLQTLRIAGNTFSKIDLSKNTELEQLSCLNVPLNSLDLSANTKLMTLGIGAEKGSLKTLDLSHNTQLITLDIYYAQFQELDVSPCQNLVALYLSQLPKLTSIDLSKNTALASLYCSEMPQFKVDVSKNPNLNTLTCTNCNIKKLDVSKNPELDTLTCSINPIESLDVSNNPKLARLYCGATSLKEIDLSHCPNLIELDVSHTKIQNLDLKDLANLNYLNVNGTSFKNMDFSALKKLTVLECGEMGLETIDVSGCSQLMWLMCPSNNLKSLDLKGMKNLENIVCSKNPLESLDLSGCPNLRWLNCNYNKLTNLDVSNCPNIEIIECKGNELTKLDLSHNPNLCQMDASKNHLTELDTSHQRMWTLLNVSLNDMTEKPKIADEGYLYYLPQRMHLQVTDLKLDSRTDNSISLSWRSYKEYLEENFYIIGLEIWRSNAPESEFEILDTCYEDDFTDDKTRQSVDYYYKVRAVYSDENNETTYGDFTEVLKVAGDAKGDGSFEDFVERLYTVALGRASEPEGKEFWVNQVVVEGKTGADCARFFLLDADEFMKRNLSVEDFVETLYATFFDRQSDEAGKKGWVDAIRSGAKSRAEVVNDFIESTEWCDVCASYGVKSGAKYHKATKASRNATEFATRLYTSCLKRPAEADGLRYWALALTNLEQTGAQAAQFFFEGDEFVGLNTTVDDYLTRLYLTFMDRMPAVEELDYWIGEIHTGKQTRHSVLAFFAQSPEFTGICKQYGIDRGEIA